MADPDTSAYSSTDSRSNEGIGARFVRQVGRTPSGQALVDADASYTYSELDAMSGFVAETLGARGVGRGDLVGICVGRSAEMIAGVLGILKRGAAYVPIDATYPRQRLREIVGDAKLRWVITSDEFVGLFAEVETIDVHTSASQGLGRLGGEESPPVDLNDRAYVIYTSGSTGVPKAIEMGHHPLVQLVQWQNRASSLPPAARTLQFASLSFDVSFQEIFSTLTSGGTLVLMPVELRHDPIALLHHINRHAIQRLFLPVAALQMLSEGSARAGIRCPSLVEIITAGEALRITRRVREFFAAHTHCRLVNQYGPAETHVVTSYTMSGDPQSWPTLPPIGRPIDHAEIYVLDDSLQPVSGAEVGELCVGVPLAMGYLGRPDWTAERFVRPPFAAGVADLVYRTGDLARRLPSGDLEFLGRRDQQLKIRGHRVEPGEIEAALLQHSAVREASVVAREEASGGSSLVAYLVTSPRDDATSAAEVNPRVERERVAHWAAIWDETYLRAPPASTTTLNAAGWNSSYTGMPMSEDEMSEWARSTADRILELRPRSVLEIGCGSGMILGQVARHTERYVATDISQVALRQVQQHIVGPQGLSQVSLRLSTADDLTELGGESFDTILINSVTQHFPSCAYLRRVLDGLVSRVSPGGVIFVGDVSNQMLREAFHASIELAELTPDDSLERLRHGVLHRGHVDRELTITPQFFDAYCHTNNLVGADVRLRRGKHDNEMNRFRYDATLHCGPTESPLQLEWLDWQPVHHELSQLDKLLRDGQMQLLAIRDIPNRRVLRWCRIAEWLKTGQDFATVRDLEQEVDRQSGDGIDPEQLAGLGESLGYHVRINVARSGAAHMFDAILGRNLELLGPRVAVVTDTVKFPPLEQLVGAPASGESRVQHDELLTLLRRQLPEYMIPSEFVFLRALPKTQSGKIDRRRLPPSRRRRPSLAAAYVAPRNELETELASIWRAVLQLDAVGIHDSFFDLGGDSIRTFEMTLQLNERTGIEIPATRLFRFPTIAALADSLAEAGTDADIRFTSQQRGARQRQALARRKRKQ